jgi:iron complex outermembrane recepter protein
MPKLYILLSLFVLLSNPLFSQTQVKGIVRDNASNEPLIGVDITLKGKQIGTITDKKGAFTFFTKQKFPLTIIVSSVGYDTQEKVITDNSKDVEIRLKESNFLAPEVVVSSSRIEESSLKSIATIETLNAKNIQESPATNFYDALRNLKNVDFTTNSVFFSAINIRGANATGNTRVVQLIDGMDNQAPGLNFAIGNLVGISELDLEKVELMPGASSALYGSAAVAGTILMNSKNPFQHQGLSVLLKNGIMNASNRVNNDGSRLGTTPLTDFSIRYAKSFRDKIAFKINVSYQKASDWQANDSTDAGYRNGFTYENGTRLNNPGYNGINAYGDEVNTNLSNLRPVFTQLLGLPIQSLPASISPVVSGIKQIAQLTNVPINTLVNEFIPTVTVGRTGYRERDLADYNSYNLKLNAALHYRINEKAELILQANYGTGTTVYTASDRYFIKNFNMGQYKIELKGSNFFVRAYTNQERSGDSYAIGIQSSSMNEAWKKSFDNTNLQTTSASWFPQYGLNYAGGAMQVFSTAYRNALAAGQNSQQAYQTAIEAKNNANVLLHQSSRAFADNGRPVYGSESFNQLANQIAQIPIPNGAKFLDKTNLYHAEFMYNFSQIKFANVLFGGSYRQYQLRSEGTIFARNAETGEEYSIHEIGAYGQAIKSILKEKLRFTFGLRYDKNLSFKGQFTPRFGVVISPKYNHNIRVSYQTAFRLPTSQDQYIDLSVPGQHNLGGVRTIVDKYDLDGKAFTQISYNAGKPELYRYGNFEPEKIQSFEIGYKTQIKNFFSFDAVYYHSTFINKIGSINVVKVNPDKSTEVFNIVESYPDNTFQHGLAFSVKVGLPLKFYFTTNYSKDVSNSSLFGTENFAVINTIGNVLEEIPPRNRWNFSLGNSNLFNTGINFNISYRHQSPSSNFTSIVAKAAKATQNQPFIPELNLFDAQISKKISSLKTIVKLGGTNIGGDIYRTTIGNPYVGSTYYVSLTFDELMN